MMAPPTRRQALGIGVLLAWGAVVGFHIRREYFRPMDVVLAQGARALAPGAQFYVVRMNGHAIGYASSRLDTVATGFRFDDLLALDVPALDTLARAVARTRVDLDHSLRLRAFGFELTSGMGRFSVVGETRRDSVLSVTVSGGGVPQRSVLRLDPSVTLDAALPMRLATAGRLAVGGRYRARIFDPSVLAVREATVRVTAADTIVVPDSAALAGARWRAAGWDTVPVWRVEEEMGGVSVSSWVDVDGRVVRAESPLGFTIERTAYELARQEWREAEADRTIAAGYGPLIESTAIASNVDLGAPGATSRLAVRLTGVDPTGFDLSGGRQRLHGDTLFVVQESAAELRAGYTLPYHGGGVPGAALESTPLIQSADPEIVARARRIARGSADPADVALKLNHWVYGSLAKQITPSVPSAVQVLRERRGDCNEHTVLYVALARSLGLPARTAVGLVYLRGRFYYHAWPEVWLGRWVAMDPTLGEAPADAAHLRFLVGGLARQMELIRLLGRLHLEVVG